MDLTPYVAALRDDLAAAAAVGDEATSRAGSTLAAALEPAVRLALMNALSDLAGEIDAALPEHTVGLRLRGREVDVSVEPDRRPGTNGAEDDGGFFAGPSSSPFAGPGGAARDGGPGRPGFPSGFPGGFPGGSGFPDHGGFGEHGGPDVGDISRMTLRIVDQIKGQAEKAAAAQGMSLNSWVSQAVQGALRGQGGWPGRGPEGGERSGRARWTDGRPDDEQPRAGRAGTDDAQGGATSSGSRPEGPSGGSSGGSSEGSSEGRGDRRDDRGEGRRDDPGDGGVQGWVRG